MTLIARAVAPEWPHRFTPRGNNRQDVFLGDDDRRADLAILQNQADRCGLSLLGYRPRSSHVHLVMVRVAWKYQWSSARARGEEAEAERVVDLERSRRLGVTDRRALLAWPEDQTDIRELRFAASRGRPLGSDGFESKLETALGRRLRPLLAGRPRNKEEK